MFKRKTATALLGFACAYVATVITLAGLREVGAAYRQLPSSLCHASTDNVGPILDNGGAINVDPIGPAVQVHCPVVSETSFVASTINLLVVDGHESTDGAYSAACACVEYPSLSCSCPSVTFWRNRSPGSADVAELTGASLSEWGAVGRKRYRWALHYLTPGSTLIGYQVETP